MQRLLLYIMALVVVASCQVTPSDFAIEGVEIFEAAEDAESLTAELTLRNDSKQTLYIRDAEIVTIIKDDALVTFTLLSEIALPAQSVTHVASNWSIIRNDPATLYSMRRRPIEHYIDRLTFDFEVRVSGISKRDKTFKKRGLHGSDIGINVEKLLR